MESRWAAMESRISRALIAASALASLIRSASPRMVSVIRWASFAASWAKLAIASAWVRKDRLSRVPWVSAAWPAAVRSLT